jgi:hypothetical protein
VLSASTYLNSPAGVVCGAAMEFGGWLAIGGILVAIYGAIAILRRWMRWKHLIKKYGPEIGKLIFAKRVWQGMTTEQLLDSWGDPEDLDEKVLKSKTKQVWKYGNNGRNRYRQRVFIEDSVVVGWQDQ